MSPFVVIRCQVGRDRLPPSAPLTEATVIPAGQRCSQQLRRYFLTAVGPSFTFDAAMRQFITDGAGQTLGSAVAHWHATRSRAPAEIGDQFELDAFVRRWHRAYPARSRADALAAWRIHRDQPVEARDSL